MKSILRVIISINNGNPDEFSELIKINKKIFQNAIKRRKFPIIIYKQSSSIEDIIELINFFYNNKIHTHENI